MVKVEQFDIFISYYFIQWWLLPSWTFLKHGTSEASCLFLDLMIATIRLLHFPEKTVGLVISEPFKTAGNPQKLFWKTNISTMKRWSCTSKSIWRIFQKPQKPSNKHPAVFFQNEPTKKRPKNTPNKREVLLAEVSSSPAMARRKLDRHTKRYERLRQEVRFEDLSRDKKHHGKIWKKRRKDDQPWFEWGNQRN